MRTFNLKQDLAAWLMIGATKNVIFSSDNSNFALLYNQLLEMELLI